MMDKDKLLFLFGLLELANPLRAKCTLLQQSLKWRANWCEVVNQQVYLIFLLRQKVYRLVTTTRAET